MKVYAYNNRIVYANYNRRRCTSLKHMLIVKTKNDIVPERSKLYVMQVTTRRLLNTYTLFLI